MTDQPTDGHEGSWGSYTSNRGEKFPVWAINTYTKSHFFKCFGLTLVLQGVQKILPESKVKKIFWILFLIVNIMISMPSRLNIMIVMPSRLVLNYQLSFLPRSPLFQSRWSLGFPMWSITGRKGELGAKPRLRIPADDMDFLRLWEK